MFESQYFVFTYSSDMSYGGNPPTIYRLLDGNLEEVFSPYDFDEMGEFHNEAEIYNEAIRFLKGENVAEVLTFDARPNRRYFDTSLTDHSEDNIDTFCRLSLFNIKQLFEREGITVRVLQQSDLEEYCSE